MSSDFYQSTSALHEEFEKKELSYLHAERKLNSNLAWKSGTSMQLQDYLNKIHKREKETEDIYNAVMKQMEELDKRADLMSFRLEKLNALKSSVISFRTPSWTSDIPDKNLFATSASNATLLPHFEFKLPSQKHNCESASTQTESIVLCEKCQFPLSVFSKSSLSGVNEKLLISNEIPYASHTVEKKSSIVPSMLSDKPSVYYDSAAQSSDLLQDSNLNCNMQDSVLQSNAIQNTETSIYPSELPNRKSSSIQSKDVEYKDISVDKKVSTKLQEVTTAVEQVIAKSDDESMNHEFDFLESDKQDSTDCAFQDSTVKANPVIDNLNPMGHNNTQYQENYSEVNVSISDVQKKYQRTDIAKEPIKKENILKNIRITDNILDEKSDSSISDRGPQSPSVHSENVSVGSDSDSFYERETPLTATATYQAILGNIQQPSRREQKDKAISDSGSEDEVEAALAKVVRKSSNIIPVATFMVQKEKEKKKTDSQVEEKNISRVSKPVTVNKPQSKLTKNTKKVLGLATSSGSEVDLEINTSTKKSADDSDEFDFYD